jgi:hypothetical protein
MSNLSFARTALLAGVFTAFAAVADAGPRAIRDVTLPAGTLLPLTLDTYVASDTSGIESPVHAHLRRAVLVDGVQVLPAGTRISGIVTEARRSARVKGRARLAFRFTSMAVNDDSYRVQTSRVVREAAGTKKRDALTIGIPAGAGAVIGGLTKGDKGAAIGSVIGGSAGTAAVLSTRGKEVRIGRGAAISVRLMRAVRVVV